MFVFYDTETTGIDKNFIQILQMGLLFTDADLNVMSSKKSDCRNSPWALPAPSALLTTGFTPEALKSAKSSNFEMMQEIYDWLKEQHWPLTFVGYNSITYDEPVLAQNFYETLLPAGLTTMGGTANNELNGRADVMHMVQAALLYMPGALKLDAKNYYGLPSLTLKAVAQQNGVALSNEEAHDALNDIKATVGVAKVIRKSAPQIWDQMMGLTTSAGVGKFIEENKIFTYLNPTHYDQAAKKPYPLEAAVVTAIAAVEGTSSEALFDLRVDPALYMNMSVKELKDIFLAQDRNAAVKLVSKDGQPVLMPMELSDAVIEKSDDMALFEARAKKVRSNTQFAANVAKAAAQAQAEMQKPAIEMPETMMEAAVSPTVRAKLDNWSKDFRTAEDWEARAALVRGFRTTFKLEVERDPSLMRFAELGARIVYEHSPQSFTALQQDAVKKLIAKRLLNPDPDAPYMTIARARKELSTIEWIRRQPNSTKWKDISDTEIRRLKLFYTAIEKDYAQYSPYAANGNVPAVKPVTDFKTKAPKGP